MYSADPSYSWRYAVMPSTVRLVAGQSLLFSFPYDPEINGALRDVTDNRVHWDAKLRGFTSQPTGLTAIQPWLPSSLAS